MNFITFLENLVALYGENLLWYAGFAFPFFIVFWVIGKRYFKKIRIQETESASLHHFKHDLGFSASTFLVFALMDVCFLYLESKGYTRIYFDIADYGYWWLIVSFCIVLFIDDMFFYWSHRAMHHPRLYKFFHRVHHESTDPSPLTAFAFHPSEAVVEQLMHVLLPFLLPLNFGVMIAWQIFSMLNNVLGHLGYEVYPKGWVKLPLLRFKTASTHHNMHHQLFNGNYALYFTWWDNWMGTAFKDYETRHEQIFERKYNSKSSEGLHTLKASGSRGEANGETLFRTFSISNIDNAAEASRQAQVFASIFDKTYQFETQEGKTILQSGLEQGIPLPYSCQRGLCGMCKMKCTEGSVTMRNNQVLTEQDLNAAYILTCQALPQTATIRIEKA